MVDRYNVQSQLEHLQSKQVGTGHPDTMFHEFMLNVHRDSYCTYLGKHDMLDYFSLHEGESRARLKFQFYKKLVQPFGPNGGQGQQQQPKQEDG